MVNIFHPTDFSSEPDAAFAHALKLAWATHSRLTLFHVNESLDELNWQEFPSVRATLDKWDLPTTETSKGATPHSNIEVEKILYKGHTPSPSILKHLERHPADLIVLATHQLGGRPFFPSVAEPIARKSHTMTLFIPKTTKGFVSTEDGSLKLQNILIPIDHDPHPRVAFQAVMSLLNVLHCESVSITVLYLGEKEEMPQYYPFHRDKVTWKEVSYIEEIVDGILETAQKLEADLIVMPTQGHQGFLDALRGSTTEQIVRQAACPVLAVPTE